MRVKFRQDCDMSKSQFKSLTNTISLGCRCDRSWWWASRGRWMQKPTPDQVCECKILIRQGQDQFQHLLRGVKLAQPKLMVICYYLLSQPSLQKEMCSSGGCNNRVVISAAVCSHSVSPESQKASVLMNNEIIFTMIKAKIFPGYSSPKGVIQVSPKH